MEFERILRKLGDSSLILTIPIDLVKFLDLQEGTMVVIEEHGGIVTLKKKTVQEDKIEV